MGQRPKGPRVIETQRSRTFSCRELGTTTYATVEDSSGEYHDMILEEIFDQPTVYPLDPDLSGVSADLRLFLTYQQQGKNAARQYAVSHGENTGDDDYSEVRRRIYMLQVARRARAITQERQNRRQGARRFTEQYLQQQGW